MTEDEARAYFATLSWASDPDGFRDLVSPDEPPAGLLVWDVDSAGDATPNRGGLNHYPGRLNTLWGWYAASDTHTLLLELDGFAETFTEPKPW